MKGCIDRVHGYGEAWVRQATTEDRKIIQSDEVSFIKNWPNIQLLTLQASAGEKRMLLWHKWFDIIN